MMPFSGVRISWLIAARNADFARVPASAASAARALRSLRSAISRPARSISRIWKPCNATIKATTSTSVPAAPPIFR